MLLHLGLYYIYGRLLHLGLLQGAPQVGEVTGLGGVTRQFIYSLILI